MSGGEEAGRGGDGNVGREQPGGREEAGRGRRGDGKVEREQPSGREEAGRGRRGDGKVGREASVRLGGPESEAQRMTETPATGRPTAFARPLRTSARPDTAPAPPPTHRPTGPRLPVGLPHALLRWVVLALAVAVWEVAARVHGSVYFPPPGRIARHMYELWFSGPVQHVFLTEAAVADILPSLGRMAAGFALAAVAGVALGVAVGRSRRAYALCNPVLQFARAVPPPALVPVFVVVFDFGTPMQIASIVFSAVWPVLINTAEGARNTDPLRLDVAAVLRLGPVERLRFLILPSALPRIFAGLRLSLSLSLILMVFSELLPGTANGIGFTLTDAQTRSDLLTVWAALVLLGALGYLLNTGLLAVEKRLVGRGRSTA